MTDTPPEFAEAVRPCAGDSGRREAGGKELAKQKAEGQGCGGGLVGQGVEAEFVAIRCSYLVGRIGTHIVECLWRKRAQ